MSLAASATAARKLEPYLLLARNARGAAAVKLIEQATSAQDTYVFGELLELPSIQELRTSSEHAASYQLLEVFAYGTLSAYRSSPTRLPPLKDEQTRKLRLLSLVSLCRNSRQVAYTTLLPALELHDVRTLEDLIIDAIYAGILSGRLDQKDQKLLVEGCIGRDVRGKAELTQLLAYLESWSQSTKVALTSLEQQMEAIQSQDQKTLTAQQQHEGQLIENLARVAQQLTDSHAPFHHQQQSGLAGSGGIAAPGGSSWAGKGMSMAAPSSQAKVADEAMDIDTNQSSSPARQKKKSPALDSGRDKRSKP